MTASTCSSAVALACAGRFFVEHFTGFLNLVYREGSRVPEGSYRMDGIKSDRQAELHWSLARRLNYVGPNTLTVEWRLAENDDGRTPESGRERFDLSTGQKAL